MDCLINANIHCIRIVADLELKLTNKHNKNIMTYKDERDGKEKELKYLEVIDGETRYRISSEYGEVVITKIDFDDDVICVKPKVRNQISIK